MNPENSIPWRTRADLLSIEHAAPTETSYTVKDPVKDEFYFFSHVEYFFLKHLRCPQTFSSLIQAAATELGWNFGIRDIQQYLHLLARDNLIVPQQLGDGDRLYRQRELERSGHWKQQVLGLLSIKLPGFHPGGILPPLRPVGALVFNPVALSVFAVVVLATVLFAIGSFSSLSQIVPTLTELMTPEHITAVLIGFVVVKILHELGHAVACQYTGHECTEMGILLLVFLPCLYCDVSDLWTETRKWKRILVSLAGVYVELAIAIGCFWIWFFTVPGSLHSFCYSMMLIASVNTLFINGNPLMRYDGYYALSDLTGIHNLGGVSRQRLSSKIRGYFLRHTPVFDNQPLPRFLLAYAAAAMVYRWLILAAITVGIWTFFDFQQLQSIGYLVVGVIGLIVVIPLLMNFQAIAKSIVQQGLRWFNTLVFLVLLSGFIYLVLGIEFSHRVWGQAEIQLANPDYIFAPADGKFVNHVSDGQTVETGDPIASIESPELALESISLAGQLREAQLNLQVIKLKPDSHLLAGQTEQWRKRESTLKRQLSENQRKRKELAILAPSTGKIVAIPTPESPSSPDSLSGKTDSLFAEQNRNCQVNRGDPICYVGQVNRMQGFIAVDQQDIDLIEVGQPVKISVPFETDFITASVVDIAIENQPADPSKRDLPTADETQVTYQVEIEFPADSRIRVGSTRQAVIVGSPTTVLAFVRRWLRNSFWF